MKPTPGRRIGIAAAAVLAAAVPASSRPEPAVPEPGRGSITLVQTVQITRSASGAQTRLASIDFVLDDGRGSIRVGNSEGLGPVRSMTDSHNPVLLYPAVLAQLESPALLGQSPAPDGEVGSMHRFQLKVIEEKDLGTREISGTSALGRRVVYEFPAVEGVSEKPYQDSVEWWKDAKTGRLLRSVRANALQNTTEIKDYFRVERIELAAELFDVPIETSGQ
jgi:hypothetical protein